MNLDKRLNHEPCFSHFHFPSLIFFFGHQFICFLVQYILSYLFILLLDILNKKCLVTLLFCVVIVCKYVDIEKKIKSFCNFSKALSFQQPSTETLWKIFWFCLLKHFFPLELAFCCKETVYPCSRLVFVQILMSRIKLSVMIKNLTLKQCCTYVKRQRTNFLYIRFPQSQVTHNNSQNIFEKPLVFM